MTMDFQNRFYKNNAENAAKVNFSSQREYAKMPDNPANIRSSSEYRDEEKEVQPKKIVKFLDGIITASLGLIFFSIPLFFTGFSLQGIIFEKQILFYFLILLGLVAWVSKGVIVGEMKIVRTPLDIPLLLFWAINGMGILFSVDKWHSFWGSFGDPSRGFMSLTALVIAYYLIVSHFSKKRFFIFIASLVASNFLLVVWSLINIMGPEIISKKILQFIPLSPFGSLTGLGIFLSAILPLAAMLCFHAFSEDNLIFLKKWQKIFVSAFLLVTLILNLFALLILYSYVFWFGVLAGVCFFLIYVLAQIVRPSSKATWIPMFVFVAILAILMVGKNSISRSNLPIEARPSYQLSLDITKNALKDSFLIGSGPATYGYAFSLHRPQDFNENSYYSLRFSQGSGLFFESLPTIGIIGTFFLVLLVLTFLSIGIYLLSINKNQNKMYSLGIFSASLIALLSVLVTKVEGSVLIISFLLIALSVGMLLLESNTEKKFLNLSFKASPKYALSLAFVFMVVSAGVIFLFFFLGKIYFADMQAGLAMREMSVDSEKSIKKIERAVYLNSLESRYCTLLGQRFMLLANSEAKKAENERDLGRIQSYLNNSITFANIAKNMSGRDVVAIEALAQIYENSGFFVMDSFKFAEENYKRALELEPHNPLFSVKLGQIKLAQASTEQNPDESKKKIGEAAELFQKAIDEKKNLAVAYYELALSKEALGDLDGAIKMIEQAVILESGNINYIFNVARIRQNRGNEDDLKIAETIYKNIIEKNENDINASFNLGLLYEKTKKTSEASEQYKKVLTNIPKDSEEVKTRIEKMISNIANGIENKPETLNMGENQAPIEEVQVPQEETSQNEVRQDDDVTSVDITPASEISR